MAFRLLSAGLVLATAMFSGAQAACPEGSKLGSLDANGGCICPSGYKGTSAEGTCAGYDVASVCPGGVLPTTKPVNTSLAGMELTTLNMTGGDTLVRFFFSMPMMSGRNYTEVGVTGPSFANVQPDCTADKLFTSWTTIDPAATQGGCVENWNITVDFTALRKCGFEISQFNDLTTGFQSFDGAIRVQFDEPVTVGTGSFGQVVTRAVLVDYPVRINFDSNYVTTMTVSGVKVVSRQQVDIAITGQNIPKDPTAQNPPTATITYTVQYPYAVVEWGTPTTTDPITATVTSMNETKICTKDVDFSASTDAATATCRKSDNTLTFNTWNGTQSEDTCKFSEYQYVVPFTVRCANGVDPADCPLAAPDTSGSVTFTITTENFCTMTAESDVINGAIKIEAFRAVQLADYATTQNAWRWNDDLFMRMDFTGLPLQTCHLTKLERYYGTEPIVAGADLEWTPVGSDGVVDQNSGDATTSITLSGFTDVGEISTTNAYITLAQGNFGLQASGQEYRFRLKANEALLGSGSEPTRGADNFLQLRATIDVTYDTPLPGAGAGRRRRRQATGGPASGGKGVKESDVQSLGAAEPTVAEAAPNSAARASPVFALLLAAVAALFVL